MHLHQTTTLRRKLDRITRQQTAFPRFEDMLDAKGHYSPTLELSNWDRVTLAIEYNKEQERREDDRRAYTYRNQAMGQSQKFVDEPLAYIEHAERFPTTVSGHIKAYRADCKRVLAEAKKDARGKRRSPEYTRAFPKARPHLWHFVGRGVEIIALDEKGERDDDLGGPEFCPASSLTVAYLKDFVAHATTCARADGKKLSAIHLAGGFDVYDSFAEYMTDMREGGCGDYEIWDDWAGQDIPVELLQ
jgi:hypothetical protein